MSFVIQLGGKQYMVQKGQKVIVDRLTAEVDAVITVPVLFDVQNPNATKSTAQAKIVDHIKAEKIRVVKYKAKSNYHKVYGHRSYQTILEIQ
jgi:large subunit ribosomal protein L21